MTAVCVIDIHGSISVSKAIMYKHSYNDDIIYKQYYMDIYTVVLYRYLHDDTIWIFIRLCEINISKAIL